MDFNMEECGGCQTCEIACSFKLTGEFNPLVSSMEIIELDGMPGYKVRIYEDNDGNRIGCDGCLNVDGDPYCVQYCHKPVELKEIIYRYRTMKNIKSND